MKTIKLPYTSTTDLSAYIRQYSCVVRYAYIRFREDLTEKDIRLLSKSLNNIELLSPWLIQCAIRDAKAIHKRFGDEKIIFGGKHLMHQLCKGKISKEQYRARRLHPLCSQGEAPANGNRIFFFDLENNKLIFKVSKRINRKNTSIQFDLQLPKLRKNIRQELQKLQDSKACDGCKYTVRLTLSHVYISFEEFKEEPIELDENVCMGIDMNPESIGLSISSSNKVIHAQEFSLSEIFHKVFKEKLASSSDKMKYLHNKLQFETYEISKQISLLAKKYKCKTVYIEDLTGLRSTSGIKKVNRKNNNLWKRNLFAGNLERRLSSLGIQMHKVHPAYSSFIGNMMHTFSDPINAAIEIARRGYEYRILGNKNSFYPKYLVKHQWKEMATNYSTWKELFLHIKNMKLKYRVSLEDAMQLHDINVFQQKSRKSMISYHIFTTDYVVY
jgi:IS605 OrfB family transposase